MSFDFTTDNQIEALQRRAKKQDDLIREWTKKYKELQAFASSRCQQIDKMRAEKEPTGYATIEGGGITHWHEQAKYHDAQNSQLYRRVGTLVSEVDHIHQCLGQWSEAVLPALERVYNVVPDLEPVAEFVREIHSAWTVAGEDWPWK